MKKRTSLILLALLLAISMVAIGCPDPAVEVVEEVVPWPGYPDPQFVWRIQTLAPAGVAAWFEPFVDFTERVGEISGGRLIVEPFSDGAIVGTFKVFDAVVGGVFEGFHSWPSYWVGKEPAFNHVSGMAMGFPEQWMKQAWFWERGGIDLVRELYAEFDLFYVGPIAYGAEIMQFIHPVDDLDDFAGLLFRTPAGMTADLLTAMGAAVTVLPGGEIFTALELGVIEGFEWCPIPINFPMGFHLLAPYFIHPGFHLTAGTTSFVVHMDDWNALPADLQEIVVAAVREWSYRNYQRVRVDEVYYLEVMLDDGNIRMPFPEEDIAEIRLMALDIWERWAEKSPMSAAIVESQIEFKRYLGIVE